MIDLLVNHVAHYHHPIMPNTHCCQELMGGVLVPLTLWCITKGYIASSLRYDIDYAHRPMERSALLCLSPCHTYDLNPTPEAECGHEMWAIISWDRAYTLSLLPLATPAMRVGTSSFRCIFLCHARPEPCTLCRTSRSRDRLSKVSMYLVRTLWSVF